MNIYVTDIDWDIDGENVYLPKNVVIVHPKKEVLDNIKSDECDDYICNYLSAKYGYCAKGFNVDIDDMEPRTTQIDNLLIEESDIRKAEQVLIDNGIEPDEASIVLQAIGYVLLGEELYM